MKISQLPTAGGLLSLDDVVPVVHDVGGTPSTRRATLAEVLALGGGAPGWVNVADFGALGNCVGGDPTTGTNDAPAFVAALTYAYANGKTGLYIPPRPPGFSYRFDSRVLVTFPVHILGFPGAHRGNGKVRITLAAGLESAFTFVDGEFASGENGGPGAEGSVIEGVHIKCTPTAPAVLYAPNTAYTLGQHIKAKFNNRHLYKVIKAGTSSADDEVAAIKAHDPHFSDRAKTWAPGETIYWGAARRSSNTAQLGVVFYATTPAEGASAGTTGGSEPAWNYTIGQTTNDNGIVWTCYDDPGSVAIGTAWIVPVHMTGIYVVCPVTVRDCYVESPQTAGIVCIGNASIPGPGSDTIGWEVIDTTIKLTLAGGESMGLWVRGGQNRFGLGQNITVVGTASSGQGAAALPTDKSASEHGIHDETFLGGNRWVGCYVKYCKGYDFAATGSNNVSSFVGCVSDAGRIRLDASSWFGPEDAAKFWGPSGIGYASSSSSVGASVHRAVAVSGAVTAGLAAGSLYHYVSDTTGDGGSRGLADSGPWVTYCYGNVGSPAWSVSNNSVTDDGNNPNGETYGALRLDRGFAIGDSAAYRWEFPTATAYRNASFRGGYRRVGDVVRRSDVAALGAHDREVVTTAGWTGPTWTATTAVYARVAPVSAFALQATVVIPTSASNDNAFLCTVSGTTGGVEPNWATAPNVNDTVVDGTATWKNIGKQAKLTPGGTLEPTGVSTVSTTGNIDNLATDGIKEIRLTGAAPVIRGLAGGVANREIVLTAIGGNVVINNEDANSAAANRIELPSTTGTIAQKTCVRLRYDATSQRWREFSALART